MAPYREVATGTGTGTTATKKGRKEKKKFVIEGPDDFDPLGGLKKLLTGFCDPSKMNDDASTIATLPSAVPDLAAQNGAVREKGVVENDKGHSLSYGLDKVEENPDLQSEQEEKKKAKEETTKEVKSRELPELKATHQGSNLRVRRGIEVTIFSFLAVFGTLFALHKLGYKFDFSVMDSRLLSEPKKFINIVYNDNVDKGSIEEYIVDGNDIVDYDNVDEGSIEEDIVDGNDIVDYDNVDKGSIEEDIIDGNDIVDYDNVDKGSIEEDIVDGNDIVDYDNFDKGSIEEDIVDGNDIVDYDNVDKGSIEEDIVDGNAKARQMAGDLNELEAQIRAEHGSSEL
jgi:outer membrane murein-binding lipoprotein Lpp